MLRVISRFAARTNDLLPPQPAEVKNSAKAQLSKTSLYPGGNVSKQGRRLKRCRGTELR
ncbi:hypothetical protein Q7C36_013930 [Tachysurus vachellii]|uniref:Uncharacterized protein n=1 Tax=Tachysurus vachellii TaxID=175792 RepID=A0AA88SJY9_TACVA|nr:hypothetical protein Q7C36_013930 [Tachysurus vachellii]